MSSECSDTHTELLRLMGNPICPHQDAPLDPEEHAGSERSQQSGFQPEEHAGSERSQQSGFQECRPNPPSVAPPDEPPPPIVVLAAEEKEERARAVGTAEDNPLHPSVTVHNTAWYKDDIAAQQDINVPVLRRDWCIRDSSGISFAGHGS